MNTPSRFLPAPFAMHPGAFAQFHAEMSAPQNPVQVAAYHYHLAMRADSWADWCECQAQKRVGMQIDAASGIAVQPVIGRMMDGVSPEWEAYGGWFNTARITEAARRTVSDDAVRALLLYVDSPGGYIPGIHDAAVALRSVSGKPVIAYLKNAMSAALYVACGCLQRHAPRSAEIGSIGTFIVTRDDSRFYAMNGSDIRLFTDGKFKGMGQEGVKWTDEWYQLISARVAEGGKEFKDFVRLTCPRVPAEAMEGQSYPASSLLRAGAVGTGQLIHSCPDDSGKNGFPRFDDLFAAVAAAL